MATVTVYEELLTLFRRFAENVSESATVIAVWRKTLDAPDQIVLPTLSLLRAVLGRAMDQISASTILDVEDKEMALAAIRQLDDVINPNLFHRRSDEVAKYVGSAKISMLILLANSMMMEFPEAIVIRDEIASLSSAVEELGFDVRNSNNLDVIFKNWLLGQIRYMSWAIRNTELIGVDAIYTAFGPPLLFMRHQTSKKDNRDGDDLEPKRAIYRRIDDLFQRIIDKVAQQA